MPDRATHPIAWQLWQPGEVLKIVAGIDPLLASWEQKDRPAQVRLTSYLERLVAELGPLPDRRDLFLAMEIDVRDPVRLVRHLDLENYLTPVVYRLGAAHFGLVLASKRVGGGSSIALGLAEPGAAPAGDWGHFDCQAGSGTAYRRWKNDLRLALAASQPAQLPPGPVEVQLAWRCSPGRNWSALWKPTGDALGPVLGEPDPRHPFNPGDDRIVCLALHRNLDQTVGHAVDVGMWWRPAGAASSSASEPSLMDLAAMGGYRVA